METGLLKRFVMAAWIVVESSAACGTDGSDVAGRLAAADRLEEGGEYAAAQKILVDLLREVDSSKDGDLVRAVVLNNLGSIYHYLDQDAKAESCYRRSIELHERLLGAGDPRTIRANLNLALLYVETNQPARAERMGLQALMERQDAIAGNDRDRARLFSILGAVKKVHGRFGEAERYCRQSLAIWERVQPDGAETMRALNNLGAVYAESGRGAEAVATYKRALAVAEKAMGPEHPALVTLLANTGAACFFAVGAAEAAPYYKRAVDIGEKTLGPEHALVGKVMLSYAAVLDRMDRKAEAKEYRRRAKAMLSASETTAPGRQTVEFNSLVEGSSKRR